MAKFQKKFRVAGVKGFTFYRNGKRIFTRFKGQSKSQCFGCLEIFPSRHRLHLHQGRFWPGCPDSLPVDNLLAGFFA